jgi:HK97 family phage major capsid protein
MTMNSNEIVAATLKRLEGSAAEALATHKSAIEGLQDRLEAFEAQADRPKGTAPTVDRKTADAIERFYRKGDKSGLAAFDPGYDEKSMSIAAPTAGGYTHVPDLANQIIAAIGEAVPMFADVNKVQTDANEYQQIFTVSGPSAARAAESGTRNATTAPAMARVDVPLFDLYAYVPVTNELLDSSQFNVPTYLGGEVQRQMVAAIESEIISGAGAGSNQALGILTQATSAAGDFDSPPRSFSLYQYLDKGVNSPASSFDYASLVALSQALPVRYRRGAKFYASTAAIEVMRNLVDLQDRPIWLDSAGGVSGRPQSILGYEVVEAPALPDVAGGEKPVLFGNLAQAYLWASHSRGMRVIRDDVTAPGSTKFYFSLQCGGKPGDTRALKALRIA